MKPRLCDQDLVSRYTLWLEDPLCHYVAYIYTPLACDWALPHHDHGAG